MKFLASLLILSFLHTGTPTWTSDLDSAKSEATAGHKLIVLNFSGSDWCIPCIRLHKEFFSSPVFTEYAKDHLVLVNADFPRLKKNQLSKDQVKKNEAMADKYNSHGSFPLTVLLDEKGNVLKQWEGYIDEGPEAFVHEIESLQSK